MYRLYFIFVLILIFIFQWTKGQGRSVGNVSDTADESNNLNGSCVGSESYCCNYAGVRGSNYPDENHELLVNTPRSSAGNVFFGPLLIIISLLVLRALSKRAEE
ncbi:hypothetical protein [Chryseobacterium jejuense]|uniref:hypothetical protein n=1 Tax=Chryseobacterium jejuense TaxID=445960 RepID=UPI001AE83BDF|nr:hypothetical protein [Chryseobacterium jejuense]MBP2619627.1 hypothetical protein [Chryseobacterium jejuense]